ncbi:PLP-dependent aminotransferase family protein [Paenibacillus sp. N3.4]|uniref:MocR-like pyridoxine biosynthesis transcription factor PdxR n=1 Tax=Paenibacillus sp. N3.4 TaxID=2603222 RepID=UPI0021C4100C|nr:PLP-dependent aminotransferase family protein [Paenibacillus sp. N3.4]
MDFLLQYLAYKERYPSKYSALYQAMHDGILENKLKQHRKLPSTREMAAIVGVSRGTVNQVYDMLIAEGYLQADIGSGTFVVYEGGREKPESSSGSKIVLSDWGMRVSGEDRAAQGSVKEQEHKQEQKRSISFAIGKPQLDDFPRDLWNRAMYEQVRRMTESPQEESHIAEGHYALREAIAHHLWRMRGIDASPDRIVIVNGSMQAIALLTQILVNTGDPVIVERPGYHGISRAVLAAGGMPSMEQIDGHGLIPQPWEARLLFVTPSRQFPTGAVLGLERRRQLLQWAVEQNAVIVEDDYDSEFRHRGRPIEPLKVLDQEGRVVYIGTFSKTMLQDLRIGYVVLPEALLSAFVAAKRLFEPHPSGLLEQRSLAAFMASGGYERHLRRMRRVYASKFLLLQELLQEQLSTLFDWVESDAGLHLFGWWRGESTTYAKYAAACESAASHGATPEITACPPGEKGHVSPLRISPRKK